VNPKIALAGAVIAGAISAVCAIYNYVGSSQHDQNVIALEKKIALLENEFSAESERIRQMLAGIANSPEQAPAAVEGPQAAISPDRAALLGEAYKRGILPPQQRGLYEEGLRRGLFKAPGMFDDLIPDTELKKAQRALDAERSYAPMLWPYALSAFIVLITSILPWFWYFLLQRIRELSTAIRGGDM